MAKIAEDVMVDLAAIPARAATVRERGWFSVFSGQFSVFGLCVGRDVAGEGEGGRPGRSRAVLMLFAAWRGTVITGRCLTGCGVAG